jgi:hypothetical protein
MTDDWALALQARLHDFHASREQHEKWDVTVARLKQDFPHSHRSYSAQRTDAAYLFRSQRRKSFATDIGG